MNLTQFTLADLGWSNFYLSQLDLVEFEQTVPMRVCEVQRGILSVIGETGEGTVPVTRDIADYGVAVGDWILVNAKDQRPTRILDRKSVLRRRGAGTDVTSQLIAANVDTLFIVSSCNADFNVPRLERYLALALQAEVDPVVILTKADLAEDPAAYEHRVETDLRSTVAVAVDATSPDLSSILAPWITTGKTVALVGSSGVGKSTITNALTGSVSETQGIREDDAKGRHTTTARSMYPMLTGGWLIDTPGMRALRLADSADGVQSVFQDIADLAQSCRFHDCAHNTEPGCAVQAAIAEGTLDADRLKRWQKLEREDRYNSETLAEKHARSRKLQRQYNAGKARAKSKRR